MPHNTGSDFFSPYADALIKAFDEKEVLNDEKKITVNILVSKVASWYERVRTAMDYGSEETILRRAIERILKRMLFLDKDSKSLAEDLLRELVWAGYFKDSTIPESVIDQVALSIKLHLDLKDGILKQKNHGDVYEFIVGILSCEIETILLPNRQKEAMSNFMFHTLKNSVEIVDDTTQTKDAQIFIAIRKNFAKDDLPFLRYKLFLQIFGRLTDKNFAQTLSNFDSGFKEIKYQLSYPKKDRIFNHVKKITPAFLILYDLLTDDARNVRSFVKNEQEFKVKIYNLCEKRYKNIKNKVQTAILRSFVFILVTKALIALLIEGTFERIFLGSIQWASIGINTTLPPLLMVLAGLWIKTPDQKNSQAIYTDVKKLLLEENPQVMPTLHVKLKKNAGVTLKDRVFSILWLLSILLIFGIIVAILQRLHLNPLSQAIFLFFIAIITFLAYRIYQTANTYTVLTKSSLFTPIFDFFFVPVLRVGRRFTEGIAQINFILIIIDFIIEAPFKALVGFFEQWFLFLAAKREELE